MKKSQAESKRVSQELSDQLKQDGDLEESRRVLLRTNVHIQTILEQVRKIAARVKIDDQHYVRLIESSGAITKLPTLNTMKEKEIREKEEALIYLKQKIVSQKNMYQKVLQEKLELEKEYHQKMSSVSNNNNNDNAYDATRRGESSKKPSASMMSDSLVKSPLLVASSLIQKSTTTSVSNRKEKQTTHASNNNNVNNPKDETRNSIQMLLDLDSTTRNGRKSNKRNNDVDSITEKLLNRNRPDDSNSGKNKNDLSLSLLKVKYKAGDSSSKKDSSGSVMDADGSLMWETLLNDLSSPYDDK